MESMYEEIDRRIKDLQRPGWKWVKHGPSSVGKEMCAVMDGYRTRSSMDGRRNQLSDRTQQHLNKWISRFTNRRWQSIIDYNDNPIGAKSVDDVIELLEKFRAEL